ncbi:WD40/YVTN/BNR-like repeat-containing protein [Calidithermus chliarophilus]|uniref:WD40/YVTN/BNR-like repeat-containing protein n=1 Tax=Calidithermus chliarophilus TaxID=52023 RepID=UPI000415F8AD|nr:sialidase family protein [Calidithermus chliarophilus]
MGGTQLLVSTQKGLYVLSQGEDGWALGQPLRFGEIVNDAVADPRPGGRLVVATRTGHLGPTVVWSDDLGQSWQESRKPPAFQPGSGRSVDTVFWLTPGHPRQPGVWWAGSVPHGLFRSEDGGETWEEVTPFSEYLAGLQELEGYAGFLGETPGGAITHSILVDPRDPDHLYVGLSTGGVFESKDGGNSWAPLNQGLEADFLPPPADGPYHLFGQDPHRVVMHPLEPDRLYQQNHCGVYRLDRREGLWHRVGRNLPPEVGDIGFGIVVHPTDPDTAYVFPMDGTRVWPRTCPEGRPAVYRTRDAGCTWEACREGLPERAWWTVFRQAFSVYPSDPPALFFGTTSGEVWGSLDGGDRWSRLAAHLPRVLSVRPVGAYQ